MDFSSCCLLLPLGKHRSYGRNLCGREKKPEKNLVSAEVASIAVTVFFCIYFFIPLNEIYIFIISHSVSSLMERDVLNSTQLIFGHGKMSLYEKQKTELDGLLIRRIFIIVSTVSFVSFVSHIFPYIRKLKSRNTTVT